MEIHFSESTDHFKPGAQVSALLKSHFVAGTQGVICTQNGCGWTDFFIPLKYQTFLDRKQSAAPRFRLNDGTTVPAHEIRAVRHLWMR